MSHVFLLFFVSSVIVVPHTLSLHGNKKETALRQFLLICFTSILLFPYLLTQPQLFHNTSTDTKEFAEVQCIFP